MEKQVELCLKIVILGDSGVGKTALANRWIDGSFDSEGKPTIGANHQRKQVIIDGQKIDVFLWDTAGQEQFRSLASVYTRSSSCAIIVTSLVDTTSFSNIDRWIDSVRETAEDMPPLVLAINKSDLQGTAENPVTDLVNQYKDNFKGVFYTSALTGEMVDNVFRCASENAFKFLTERRNNSGSSLKKLGDSSNNSCC